MALIQRVLLFLVLLNLIPFTARASEDDLKRQAESNDSCVSCHEDVGAKLVKTESKHKGFTCTFCHKGPHPSSSTCQSCHDEPHATALHKKINSCLDCHVDPHALVR